MTRVMALALAGLCATAAQAGDKGVLVSITDVPIYSIYTDRGGVGVIYRGLETTTTTTTTSSTVVPASGAAAPAGQTAARAGLVAGNDDRLYARLVEEARKRGLR